MNKASKEQKRTYLRGRRKRKDMILILGGIGGQEEKGTAEDKTFQISKGHYRCYFLLCYFTEKQRYGFNCSNILTEILNDCSDFLNFTLFRVQHSLY